MANVTALKNILILVGVAALNGCAHVPQLFATTHVVTAAPAPVSSPSERHAAPAAAAASVTLNRLVIDEKRNGYFINNVKFGDAAGEVLDLCRFSDSGFVTYTLGDSDVLMRKHTYVVKMRDMSRPNGPTTKLGVLVREPGTRWIFKGNDGHPIEADWYRLQSQGMLLVHNRNQVHFVGADGNVRQYPLPPGFIVSSYQDWDIAATRHLLLINTSEQAQKGRGELEIGLLDLDSGKVGTLVSFAVRDKSESDQLQYVRSVFAMANSANGPLVVLVEDGERRVVVRSLRSGLQAVAFGDEGSSWHIRTGQERGKVWLTAQRGQSGERRISDVEGFLAGHLPAQAAN